jgi:gas vesicle protein
VSTRIVTSAGYFLVGLGVGSLVGILFAPKPGKQTREDLARKTREGREYAQNKARELRECAEDLVEQGKQAVTQTRDQLSMAIDTGRDAYQREKAKV